MKSADEDGGDNPYLRDPDVRLMLRAKAGEHAAFAELVARHRDHVFRVVRKSVRSHEVAEDLAQEAFLKIYRARHGYEPRSRFVTWMFRIVNNLVLNLRRDAARRRKRLLNGDESAAMSGQSCRQEIADNSAPTPSGRLETLELRSAVRAALATLNEAQRTATLLQTFDELSYAEIAIVLETTPAAVKSLLSRARQTLRARLKSYTEHGVLSNELRSTKPSRRVVGGHPGERCEGARRRVVARAG